METGSMFKLPVTDPLLVFTIILLIILLAPILLRLLKTPGIVGFIIAGMLIGPYGLNLLERGEVIILFSTVGLIYIMFLVGLDLDFNQFNINGSKIIVFGLLTFLFPFFIGLSVCIYILHLGLLPAILVSSMFSTHTLIAYPIVSRLGITRTLPVILSAGATIITDTLVLFILAVVAGTHIGELDFMFWIKMFISFVLFGFIVVWSYPRIARWLLKNLENEKNIQFVFILTLLFIASVFSKIAGLEPILGAFIAGITLNKLIPRNSLLMNRIEFVGNIFFIPFFLIGVGMLVDIKFLFSGWDTAFIILVLTITALAGKWLAAFLTQKIFRFRREFRQIMFGLTASRAAATIAVITIGFNIGLVDIQILNGTIILVFITCMVASFVTERAAKKLAKTDLAASAYPATEHDKILVSIYNPDTIERLVDLAIMLHEHKSKESLYTLSVVRDDDEAKKRLINSKNMLQKAIQHASATDNHVEIVTRIDANISSGISRTARELMITCIVMGWSDRTKGSNIIFGTILTNILNNCNQMLWVSRILQPLNTFNKIHVLLPPNAEYEIGFKSLFAKITLFSSQMTIETVYHASDETRKNISQICDSMYPGKQPVTNHFDDWSDFSAVSLFVQNNQLLLIVSARSGTLSYQPAFTSLPDKLVQLFPEKSFILIYPEQGSKSAGILDMEVADKIEF
jgi:Kef-type K+ transport system membrane component KefB